MKMPPPNQPDSSQTSYVFFKALCESIHFLTDRLGEHFHY